MARFSDFKQLVAVTGKELFLVEGEDDNYTITFDNLGGMFRIQYLGELDSLDDLPSVEDSKYGDVWTFGGIIKLLTYGEDGALHWDTLGNGNVVDVVSTTTPQARVTGSWVPIDVLEAPKDDVSYLRNNGEWVKFQIDNFNLSIKRSINGTFDADLCSNYIISGSADLTISFENLRAERFQIIHVIVEGSDGNITWPSELNWSGGIAPELGETYTIIELIWDGTRLTGAAKQHV